MERPRYSERVTRTETNISRSSAVERSFCTAQKKERIAGGETLGKCNPANPSRERTGPVPTDRLFSELKVFDPKQLYTKSVILFTSVNKSKLLYEHLFYAHNTRQNMH
ncbi:hypothetical protein WA026_010879, partial [Henosepilachna vigintioctopunctata]